MSPLEIAAFVFTGVSVWLSVKQHIASWPTAIVGVVGALFAIVLGVTLAQTTDAALPWVDSTLTSFSLVAQWQMTRKYVQNWLLWIAVDVFYIPMWAFKHLWLTSLLYVVFLVMSSLGYREWRRDVARRAAAA